MLLLAAERGLLTLTSSLSARALLNRRLGGGAPLPPRLPRLLHHLSRYSTHTHCLGTPLPLYAYYNSSSALQASIAGPSRRELLFAALGAGLGVAGAATYYNRECLSGPAFLGAINSQS